jgi:hypothetical protein
MFNLNKVLREELDRAMGVPANFIDGMSDPKKGEVGYSKHILAKIAYEEDEVMYCVKCRKKNLTTKTQYVKLKKGKPAIKGNCRECDGAMFRLKNV